MAGPQRRTGRGRLALAALALLLLLLGGVAVTVASRRAAAAAADTARVPPAGVDGARGHAPAAARSAVVVAEDPRLLRRPDFDHLVTVIAEATVAGVRAHEDGDAETTIEHDQRARAAFERVVTTFADFAERALRALAASPPPAGGGLAAARRAALRALLEVALGTVGDIDPRSRRHGELVALVAAMLVAAPQDEHLAHDLLPMLCALPCLQPEHEDDVLLLLDLARERPFLRAHATRLLRALWQQLQAGGVRSRAEIEALATVLAEHADPARRLAAWQVLIESRQDAYADLALRHVEAAGDDSQLAELAITAARAQEPGRALATLRRLRRSGRVDLTAAAVTLALRDPMVVAAGYRDLLAAGAEPAFRADLVTGVGFGPRADLELVALAARDDPALPVRKRALLALAARADPDAALAAMERALDDPALAAPADIGVMVLALQNFARTGQVDALARIARRLSQRDLLPGDRDRLDALLARTLPPGLRQRQGW